VRGRERERKREKKRDRARLAGIEGWSEEGRKGGKEREMKK